MCMSFSDIDDVRRNVCLDDKDGILVTTYIEALSLTYRIELGTIVLSDYLSLRVLLVPCLLDVLSAAPVCLCLEPDVICDRLRKPVQLFICQG